MFWLRPILLLAGALFIAALFWWERRRSRQAAGAPPARSARAEPSFDAMPMSAAGSEREQRRALPVIDWSAEAMSAGSGAAAGGAAGTSTHATESAGALASASIAPGAIGPVPLDAPVGAGRAASAAVVVPVVEPPPMIVEWPDEQLRRIVTLRIVPSGNDRLPGRAVRQTLSACGFRHGEFGIFHLPDENGRVILSAASLVLPGTLDPAAMDFQRFSGLNVFAVLPGPVSAEVALERLGHLAIEIAGRLSARVHDDRSAALGAGNAGAWRQRMLDTASAAAGPAD